MSSDSFKCAMCGGIFRKVLSHEQALANLRKRFPGVEPEECGIVCDDCFRAHFALPDERREH